MMKTTMKYINHKIFHFPVFSQVTMHLWAVLLMSGSLSQLNFPSASYTLSTTLSGLPSQMMCRTLFLILGSESSAISNTLSQKTQMSFKTLHGHNCEHASSLMSSSSAYVYLRTSSMSSVSLMWYMTYFFDGPSLKPVFFLLPLPLAFDISILIIHHLIIFYLNLILLLNSDAQHNFQNTFLPNSPKNISNCSLYCDLGSFFHLQKINL